MRQRQLDRLLKRAGFSYRNGRGRHRLWQHPNGAACLTTSDPHRAVSALIWRNALAAIEQSTAQIDEETSA
jgi:predicted RNA binding protein YcfA (HicA-like mRNA interferase family)